MSLLHGLEVYLVGGAVRDTLLAQWDEAKGVEGGGGGNKIAHDRDWVIVGADPQVLLNRGFVPVGQDFPVFLHPVTHEEYALARTERKSAVGYKGFAIHADPSVTLIQDLLRRDLTINALAVPAHLADAFTAQDVIDPYGGLQDLQQGCLRHVSPAFAEDPLRILRVARFAARWFHFTLAPETLHHMQTMVAAGEVHHLVPERVWQELARGLMEQRPSRMFAILRLCHACQILFPELAPLHDQDWQHLMLVVDRAAQQQAPLAVRFACLTHDLGKQNHALVQAWCQRLRIPNDIGQLAQLVVKEQDLIHHSLYLTTDALLDLLLRCDVLRRTERFEMALWACECNAKGFETVDYPQRAWLLKAMQVLQAVPAGAIAQAAQAEYRLQQASQTPPPLSMGSFIAQAIRQAQYQVLLSI